MGEPGQRISPKKIIDKPELKSPARHLVEGSITAVLWVIWLYWVLPILTFFLWFFGLRFAYHQLFPLGGIRELLGILRNGGYAIIIIFILNLLWIYYNYRMIFKRLGERRRKESKTTHDLIAKTFDINPVVLEEAKKKNRLRVHLDGRKLTFLSGAEGGS